MGVKSGKIVAIRGDRSHPANFGSSAPNRPASPKQSTIPTALPIR
ncbi:MAG: hypothetical protein M3P37_08895 [Actinomycetota bacterium]|nr:hypothetical protein [Actinomycetota bacterium]